MGIEGVQGVLGYVADVVGGLFSAGPKVSAPQDVFVSVSRPSFLNQKFVLAGSLFTGGLLGVGIIMLAKALFPSPFSWM